MPMQICVVHGSPRRGNTWQALTLVRRELLQLGAVEFTEYQVPNDMAAYCCGCYACFERGEQYCPAAAEMQPIGASMLAADAVILTSPAYVIGPSAAMKNFLDHTACLFMAHRPEPRLFGKPALVLSTAAGYGARQANAVMARCLRHWGASVIAQASIRIYAADWSQMPARKQQRLGRRLRRDARRLYAAAARPPSLTMFGRGLFVLMRSMMKSYPDGHMDKEYWRRQGWLPPVQGGSQT